MLYDSIGNLLMNNDYARMFTELEGMIRQTVRDLEQHSCILPSTQQEAVEATIKRLKMALEDEKALVECKRKHF